MNQNNKQMSNYFGIQPDRREFLLDEFEKLSDKNADLFFSAGMKVLKNEEDNDQDTNLDILDQYIKLGTTENEKLFCCYWGMRQLEEYEKMFNNAIINVLKRHGVE